MEKGRNIKLLYWIILLWIQPRATLTQGFGPSLVDPSASAPVEVTNVTAVIERTGELPCDIIPPIPEDKTILILWYKGNSGNPVFSLDLRVRKGHPKIDTVEEFSNRTSFQYQHAPYFLRINNIRMSDEDTYRCRVDFKKSPTRNSIVNVSIIIPPQKPTIMDEKGLEMNTVVGPFNEGSKLVLSCEAGGGKPPPRVSWWREDVLVDESYEVTSVGIVRNDLLEPSLTRDDFWVSYRCEASNNNVTAPTTAEATINMNLKPLEVKIQHEKEALSAGTRYKLVCMSSGSRPPPIMAWWNGNRRMKYSEETVSDDRNITTSVLTFTPTNEDNGKHLSCRAENPTIPQSGKEDGWKLDIYYSPIMTLRLGSSLKEDGIKEGDDVYFECSVRANPWIHKVEWKFKDEYMYSDTNTGVIISNQSLVLQKVNAANVGVYSCVGINTEGEGESNKVDLQVKHIPLCKQGQQTVYGIARNEPAKITCEVVTNPTEVTFRWAFNRTTTPIDSTKGRPVTEPSRSILVYTPRSDKDYGTLYCWATNTMGIQRSPCIFTIVPAGTPDPVLECIMINRTESSLHVRCRPGYDGGLNQTFILELFDSERKQLKTTLRQLHPDFHLTGLQAETNYAITVLASNAKGMSPPVGLADSTTKILEDETDTNSVFAVTPVLGVLIGIVAAFTLVAIAIIIVMRVRASHVSKRKEYEQEPPDRSNIPLRKDTDDGMENEEKSPDVIPSNNDHEFPPVEVKCLQKFNSNSERQCDTFRVPGGYAGVAPENTYHSWSQNKKVRPYDDSSFMELQASTIQRKGSSGSLPITRRCPGPHDCHTLPYPDHGNRRPYHEDDDVTTAETPLMNNQHEAVICGHKCEPQASAKSRRLDSETSAL